MKPAKNSLNAWGRLIGITLGAPMIVASIVGIFLLGVGDRLKVDTPVRQKAQGSSVRHVEASDDALDKPVRQGLTSNGANAKVASTARIGDSKEQPKTVAELAQRGDEDSSDEETTNMPGEKAAGAGVPVNGADSGPNATTGVQAHAPSKAVDEPDSTAEDHAPGAVEKTRSAKRWRTVLEGLHKKGFHGRGSQSAQRRAREKAEKELHAIVDPAAVPEILYVFAGAEDHRRMVVEILTRIKSPESTKGLVAVSVYSDDEKTRRMAIEALRERELTEFAELLIGLFSEPMKYRTEMIQIPSQGRQRVLLVEGERADVQFLYPPQLQPPGEEQQKIFTPDRPYMPPAERERARAFNKAQAEDARNAAEWQLRCDIAQVEALNERIVALNERAAEALRELSGERLRPNREPWKRWLAARLGQEYSPPPENLPKPTIATIVQPLYTPSFIRIPGKPT